MMELSLSCRVKMARTLDKCLISYIDSPVFITIPTDNCAYAHGLCRSSSNKKADIYIFAL